MKYSTYNDNRYNATVHKDNNTLDVKVGNPENKKHIPGAVIEYGVKSVNGKYGDVVLDYHDVGALPDTEIIPRYIVNDVEYVITKYTKNTISGIEGISLWFDDGTSSGDSVFIPSIEGLESNNAQLFQLILSNFVSYTEHQSLTPTQQEIARVNIGVDISDVTNYERLTHKPSINGVELIGNKTSEELSLLNICVVEELPTQDISSTIIYLVPLDDPKQDNHYKEYIYVDGQWELIGTTEVDLTNYYTKQEVDELVSDYVPNTRTINDKSLTNDIVLDASDVGALPDDTVYVSSVNGQTGAVTIPTATQSVSGLMSSSDKIKLDGIERGAEVNQNAFSNVVVDNTTISADSKTDTLTLIAGDNITLTPNENVDSVTISAAAPAYTGTSPINVSGSVISHNDSGVNAGTHGDTSDQTPTWGGTFKALSGTVDAKGHLTALSEHTVTIPNSVATNQSNGLMSYTDKVKLDGIEANAQVNVLEGITVNGTSASITNKIAALTVPTKTSDLINDSNFATITFVDWIGG